MSKSFGSAVPWNRFGSGGLPPFADQPFRIGLEMESASQMNSGVDVDQSNWGGNTGNFNFMTSHNSHHSTRASVGGSASESAMPGTLRDLPDGRLITLDVRPFFEKGEEPFMAIMQTAEKLAPGQALKLLVPFEPVPLFGVLARKGLSHWSLSPDQPDGAWQVYFYAEQEEASPDKVENAEDPFSAEDSGDIIELDVRGLEAPEPLERVLTTLEQMSYGSVLRVHHHREPLILFDILTERGCGYHSNMLAPDHWDIRIWRKN